MSLRTGVKISATGAAVVLVCAGIALTAAPADPGSDDLIVTTLAKAGHGRDAQAPAARRGPTAGASTVARTRSGRRSAPASSPAATPTTAPPALAAPGVAAPVAPQPGAAGDPISATTTAPSAPSGAGSAPSSAPPKATKSAVPSPPAVPTTPATSAPPKAPAVPASGLYVSPNIQEVILGSSTNASELTLLHKIADRPIATWLSGGSYNLTMAKTVSTRAAAQGELAVFVIYNIPDRDCGGYSAGGTTPSEYLTWVTSVKNAIVGSAMIVLEPDAAVDAARCADPAGRLRLLHDAGMIFQQAGHRVYLDAGHPAWKTPAQDAAILKNVGMDAFDGIALNVSNFATTASVSSYAAAISAAYGSSLHYVVDTSRNGNGPAAGSAWCNPSGRALGEPPRLSSGGALDALLWIKLPGDTDGACNGGPSSGFWKDYALGLARSAAW